MGARNAMAAYTYYSSVPCQRGCWECSDDEESAGKRDKRAGKGKPRPAKAAGHERMTDSAFRVLVYMCLTSLDDAQPPRYWAGHEALVRALGRGDTKADQKRRTADLEAVGRAVRVLTQLGVLQLTEAGRVGRNSEYSLHLKPVDIPVDNLTPAVASGEVSHAGRTPEPYARRGQSPMPGVGEPYARRPPEEEEEPGRKRDRKKSPWHFRLTRSSA